MNAPKTYEARQVLNTVRMLDGVLTAPAWQQANLETGFSFPWEKRDAPRTEFRAVYDTHALYFAFRVDDDDIVLAENFRNKEDVAFEDRVEMFFAMDDELADYYCLEIDPLGRVLDYRASHYRQFDFGWTLPGLEAVGMRTREGYAVQGVIPWKSLRSLGFPPPDCGRVIRFGIYRAEFRHAEGEQFKEGWMSWVDPQTPEPDFHVPQSFGYLKLVS